MNAITKGLVAAWRTVLHRLGFMLPADLRVIEVSEIVHPGEHKRVTLYAGHPYSGVRHLSALTPGARFPQNVTFIAGVATFEVWHDHATTVTVKAVTSIPLTRKG